MRSRSGAPATQASISSARIEGWLPGTFTLVQLSQLANALGLIHAVLLRASDADNQDAPPTVAGRTRAKDAAHVIPLLIGIDKSVPTSSLLNALGWTPARLDACLQAVDAALANTGMRLHHGQQQTLRITPARPATHETRIALRRMRASNKPITLGEASTLKRILDLQNVQYRAM